MQRVLKTRHAERVEGYETERVCVYSNLLPSSKPAVLPPPSGREGNRGAIIFFRRGFLCAFAGRCGHRPIRDYRKPIAAGASITRLPAQTALLLIPFAEVSTGHTRPAVIL